MTTPASVFRNVWYVTCKGCKTYDIVGPGHPAVRQVPETGLFEVHDRQALHTRLGHKPGCDFHTTGESPLDFSFGAAPVGLEV